MNRLNWRSAGASLVWCAGILVSTSAQAFCGFYVGKADASLFNDASQVIMAREGNRTEIGRAHV